MSLRPNELPLRHLLDRFLNGRRSVALTVESQISYAGATCLTKTNLGSRKSLKWCRGTESSCRHRPFQEIQEIMNISKLQRKYKVPSVKQYQ